MHKVDVDSLLQGKQSKYALVVGVAKRAREITQTFEEEQIVTEDKPVLIAIKESKVMKSTFLSLTKMNSDLTVKVAVENTTYVFDRLFDYLVPKAFADLVQVGKRVLVPFGRGNKKKQGVIFELSAVSDDIPAEKLKSVCSG